MCTVSWSHPSGGGLILCFNRDEQHHRPDGLLPQVWPHGILAPVDGKAGGTWLAVLPDGLVLALLNHHWRGCVAGNTSSSRGNIIPALAGERGFPTLASLRKLVAGPMNPFRLLTLSPFGSGLIFTWSGRHLSKRRIDSRKPGMLTSSSWRPASVVAARHAAFQAWSRNHLSPEMSDHLDFHTTSEHPRGTAWAVCMSRAEARSVSLNCVTISGSRAIMTHQARHEGERGFNRKIHRAKLALTSAP